MWRSNRRGGAATAAALMFMRSVPDRSLVSLYPNGARDEGTKETVRLAAGKTVVLGGFCLVILDCYITLSTIKKIKKKVTWIYLT